MSLNLALSEDPKLGRGKTGVLLYLDNEGFNGFRYEPSTEVNEGGLLLETEYEPDDPDPFLL